MKKIITALCVLFFVSPAWAQFSDSRIKTLIYDENEVYKLVTHFGYQSNIEFDKREEIQTISVGDNSAWQIIPAHRYLFIRSLQEDAHTNMTVITNKRTYQFDLRSTPLSSKKGNLVYVIKFHYPEETAPAEQMADMSSGFAAPAVPTMLTPPPAAPQPKIAEQAYNYNYTLSGSNEIAPVKVFDDGAKTYLQFTSDIPVKVFVFTADGKETPVTSTKSGSYIAVDAVADKLAVRSGNQVVKVYNEARMASMQSR